MSARGRNSKAETVAVWPVSNGTGTRPTAPEAEDLPSAAHEQLACLAALAERLATITDLDAVLEAVTDAVMTALAPAACAIDVFDEEGRELAASSTRGLDDVCADWWRTQAARSGRRAQPSGRNQSRPATQVTWPSDAPATAPRAVLQVPLAVPGQAPVGFLALFAAQPDMLPSADAPVVRNIVTQAAAAVTASHARLREVLAVYTIAQSITGRIHLAALASSVLRAVADLFAADGGAIVLAESPRPDEPGPYLTAHLGEGLTQRTAETLLECCADQTMPCVVASLSAPVERTALEGRGLVAPLRLERKLLGVMTLTYPAARHFRQSDLWLLSAVASQVTMALRNTQLYLWSEELAIAEERSRIAREIHDGLAQSLAHKMFKLDLCQKLIDRDHERLRQELQTIKESVRTDIQDVRHSILTLRPLALEQRGLGEAVQAYVSQFSHDTGIMTATQLGPLDSASPKAQTALFRLMQEALNNVRKHAQATKAHVAISIEPTGEIKLVVTDNGQGFDVDATLHRQPGQSGIGLRGMVERTEAAGGAITIESQPGEGTRIEVHLPSQ